MSSIENFAQCLLSAQEFAALKQYQPIDYRQPHGKFSQAMISKTKFDEQTKSVTSVQVQYEDDFTQEDHFAWITYEEDPSSLAKNKSVSARAASSALSNAKEISFKPQPYDKNCEWRKGKIVQRDEASGQVVVQYVDNNKTKRRWTHLDNSYEVQPLTDDNNATHQPQQAQQWQNGTGLNYNDEGSYSRSTQKMINNGGNKMIVNGNGYHDHHNHNLQKSYNPYNNDDHKQQYQQKQVQRQDQMTVRTQLLLDTTNDQIKLTRKYLEAACKQEFSAEDLSIHNQKVVAGLTCFKMKVSGMRQNAKKEGISFKDAFKSSAMIIREFENEFKSKYGNNEHLMKRLDPMINYMISVLKKKKNIPALPYINEYEFDDEVASEVMSAFNHQRNHAQPQRMKEINDNSEHYKKQHERLKNKFEATQPRQNTKDIDYKDMVQDYNSKNISFGLSKKEQQEMIKKDLEQSRYADPNVMDIDDE